MCFSMIQFYLPIAHKLSSLTKCRVILPDYRLAPENPFPAGLEDCEEAVAWTSRRWASLEDLFIVGDSAGGNLALNCAVTNPSIRGLLLMCPWLNLTHSSEYWTKNTLDDIVFPSTARRAAWLYTQGDRDWSFGQNNPDSIHEFEALIRDPRVSPSFADLSFARNVPVSIQASLDERLLGDSLSLWQGLTGVDVSESELTPPESPRGPLRWKQGRHEMSLWHGVPHVWQVTRMWTKAGQEAVTDAAKFINSL